MDLGVAEYGTVWEMQEKLMQALIDQKSVGGQSTDRLPGHLLFVEHLPVYTLGKSGETANLLLSGEELSQREVTFYKTNRGGDITFHGPGQLVGYPILDLECFEMGLRQYIERLEETIIQLLKDYGIAGERDPHATGVWLDTGSSRARKIAAIGVRSSRYVTMHGFALNVNTDLSYFGFIHPCGIPDKGVTSLKQELGRTLDMEEIKANFAQKFEAVFGARLT